MPPKRGSAARRAATEAARNAKAKKLEKTRSTAGSQAGAASVGQTADTNIDASAQGGEGSRDGGAAGAQHSDEAAEEAIRKMQEAKANDDEPEDDAARSEVAEPVSRSLFNLPAAGQPLFQPGFSFHEVLNTPSAEQKPILDDKATRSFKVFRKSAGDRRREAEMEARHDAEIENAIAESEQEPNAPKYSGKGKGNATQDENSHRSASAEAPPQQPDAAAADDIRAEDADAGVRFDGSAEQTQAPKKKSRKPKTPTKKKKGIASPKSADEDPLDASAERAQSLRTTALAGPVRPIAKAIPKDLREAGAAEAKIYEQSNIKETPAMKANTEPIWLSCEKCALYIEHGTSPSLIRRACVPVLIPLF
jgi:hypothetical protein